MDAGDPSPQRRKRKASEVAGPSCHSTTFPSQHRLPPLDDRGNDNGPSQGAKATTVRWPRGVRKLEALRASGLRPALARSRRKSGWRTPETSCLSRRQEGRCALLADGA